MNYNVALVERDGMLYVHYRAKGKLVRKSLKLKATKANIAYAEKQIIPNIQIKLASGDNPLQESKISMFFDKILKRYENKAASTSYIYGLSAKYFTEFMGNIDVKDVIVSFRSIRPIIPRKLSRGVFKWATS